MNKKKIHKILVGVIMLLCSSFAKAQGVDSLFFDARGAFHQTIKDGHYATNLRADYFNLHIFGHINDKLSYRVRQRLNVGIDASNPFKATDWLCLTWQATPKWQFYAGKTAILIGGYEYDSPPIDVYFYSQFCDNLYQYFAFSANGAYEVAEGQKLVFQVCNSPLTTGFKDNYAYNVAWMGSFTPWWSTIWSTNMIQNEDKRFVNYIALGNRMTFNNLAIDVDLFHRASPHQRRFLFSDYSLVGKLIWRVGKWNICSKVGYETNDAENVDENGNSYDIVLKAGMNYIYGGCGVEYFPLGNEDVRLHLTYFRDNFNKADNIQLGLKWKFYVIGKKR